MTCGGGGVVFDPDEFKILYPQWGSIDDTVLSLYFRVASLLCDNTPRSPVKDLCERKTLLYMLVCHIATLKDRGDSLVGTMTQAAQGSVNMSLQPLTNANWYQSTQCGAMYWAATAKFRVGIRYVKYHHC